MEYWEKTKYTYTTIDNENLDTFNNNSLNQILSLETAV